MLLSKRLLVFSGGQVYFQCRRGILFESTNSADANFTIAPCESLALPASQPSAISPVLRAPDGNFRPILPPVFETYAHLVTQYTKRCMSIPTDGIRAIAGLLNIIQPNTESMLSGLPQRFIDLALMWQPAAGNNVRLQRKPDIPSWSWAGWEAVIGSQGGVRYEKPYRVFTYDSGALRKVKPRDGEAEIRLRPVINWDRSLASEIGKQPLQARTLPQRIMSPDERQISQPSRPPPPIPVLAAPTSPTSLIRSKPIVPPKMISRKDNGGNEGFSKTSRNGHAQIQPQGPHVRNHCTGRTGSHNHHLRFETETAFFTLGAAPKPREEIMWAQSEGHLIQESIEVIYETPILQGDVEVGQVILHDPQNNPPGNVHEFAKLSEAQYFGDDDRVDVVDFPLLNVMLIKREDDDGRATRAGLGRVYKEAWKMAELTTEILTLR